jgi:hypothetical protein
MNLEKYVLLFKTEKRKHGDTGGIFIGAEEKALAVVINVALELAAQSCEKTLTFHGLRKKGSDVGDAARRVNIEIIRALKVIEPEVIGWGKQ